jgi:glutamate-ammonia-ligase adenylyltransferase
MTKIAASATSAEACNSEKIDPTRAAAGFTRWRRALAESIGQDPGARLDRPDRRLTMLRIFGSTRRLADLCMKHPAAAAAALIEGASSVLAQAARDLNGLNGGVGGPDAVYGALSPIKCRCDLAIGIAELSGAWNPCEAAAARADLAERLIEVALAWLVRGAVNRGELAAADGAANGIFALGGGDFAHEDLAPYGPVEVVVLYDAAMFPGSAARMAERSFVRIGGELREAFEGKSGDYPLFALRTPFGSSVGGAGVAESTARAKAMLADPQRAPLRSWVSASRVVAGDRTAGGGFLESVEETVWKDLSPIGASEDDPRGPYRAIAAIFRASLGASRPVFRTASSREVLETAAKSGALDAAAAGRLVAGEEFMQGLVARAQMMKGAAAFGAARLDEASALANLCGFSAAEALDAVQSGLTADAKNMFARLQKGPLAEFERYKPQGEALDDVDKLHDLGFKDGAQLAELIDQWATLAAPKERARFSALAPGLLTAFGETQRPDQAVRLFDELMRNGPDEAFDCIATAGPMRDGLVDALGCFGSAVAPLARTKALAREFFEDRAEETPRSPREFVSRFAPPGDAAKLAEIAAWRCESIARVALYAASGDMTFACAADTLSAVCDQTLKKTFTTIQREAGGDGVALHVFDGPGRGLPDMPVQFGFIASDGDLEANERFARAFMDAVDALGEGVFAFVPDVSHRPGGVGGSLVPTAAGFKAYVQSEAVAYDQILLARGAVLSGSQKARDAAQTALRAAISNPKRAETLLRDLDRARAQRLRRDRGSDWDLDRAEGGLFDADLIISTLIYRHAAAQPSLQTEGVEAALDTLARAGLVPQAVAETLKSARRFWSGLAAARSLARWTDPQREPVRSRFAAILASSAEVESFAQVRPLMRGYSEEVSRLYAQLVLGRPSLSLVANG